MPTFTLDPIEEINGKIRLFKLVLDGLSPYDGFEEQIRHDGNLLKELNTIQTRLEQIANGLLLPETKFKKLKGCKDEHTEYEIKTHNLRVYLFKEVKTGNIIVLGGRKDTQSKDIHHFTKLRMGYLAFKYFSYVK
ncbi:MAG: hypothetical protein Q8918_18615 [Bacteroidota bacterium]|nr:hypothetical protein [Bacteroidota bacterium]